MGESLIVVNVVGMITVYYSTLGLSATDISITGLSNEIVILHILDVSVTTYFSESWRNEKKGESTGERRSAPTTVLSRV